MKQILKTGQEMTQRGLTPEQDNDPQTGSDPAATALERKVIFQTCSLLPHAQGFVTSVVNLWFLHTSLGNI